MEGFTVTGPRVTYQTFPGPPREDIGGSGGCIPFLKGPADRMMKGSIRCMFALHQPRSQGTLWYAVPNWACEGWKIQSFLAEYYMDTNPSVECRSRGIQLYSCNQSEENIKGRKLWFIKVEYLLLLSLAFTVFNISAWALDSLLWDFVFAPRDNFVYMP